MDVTGKVAVVTGGGRGIGQGIVLALARNGADVAVADINADDAGAVASDVADMGRQSAAVTVDVTDQESVQRMVQEVIQRFGRIDILVNNAGVIGAPGWEQREKISEDDWDVVLSVNLKGVARVADVVAADMKERRYSKIVNIASVAGRQGTGNPAYSASKAGVINLTQSLAIELAPFNINVNAICPGLTWTPMWERIASRRSSLGLPDIEGLTPRAIFELNVKERTPLGREQTPEDIGNAVAFLTSDFARNITGQALNVSGGFYLN